MDTDLRKFAFRLGKSADCIELGFNWGMVFTESFRFLSIKETFLDSIMTFDDPSKFRYRNRIRDDTTDA